MKKIMIGFLVLLSLNLYSREITSEQKAQSLSNHLTKIALQNEDQTKEIGYSFSQKEIGDIAYFLDYYKFSIEDLRQTEEVLALSELTITDKMFEDIMYLLRSFADVGKIMRYHESINNMKCEFLYGKIQDRALEISPSYQASFKTSNGVYEPTFVGGCWSKNKYPERLFLKFDK